jgi:hypothetical protein
MAFPVKGIAGLSNPRIFVITRLARAAAGPRDRDIDGITFMMPSSDSSRGALNGR